MTLYQLKPSFQRALEPLARGLHRVGVSPNGITLLAVALSIGTGGLILLKGSEGNWLLLVPVTLFVRLCLNALDGMVARAYGLVTRRGELLNEIGDVLSDVCTYLPLVNVVGGSWVPVALFCYLSVCTEVVRVFGARRSFDGPMGKSDRAFFVGGFALLVALFPTVREHSTPIFLGACVLAAVTIANRLRRVPGRRDGPSSATTEKAT